MPSYAVGMIEPRLPRLLGFMGLLPQVFALFILWLDDPAWSFAALALSYFYAATILSFLGGMWWGMAARADRPPGWIFIAAVLPQLIAFFSAWPWVVGAAWPQPSMILLGFTIVATLPVDRALYRRGIAPLWWMSLRMPLSIGLGLLTVIGALLPAP